MIAFSIWNIHIYWYGIFYLVWFLVTYFLLKFIWKKGLLSKYKKVQKILDSWVEDLMIYLILWVLLWWRLWEVFIYQWSYFSTHLAEIFAVWNWWMAFFGWFIWVVIALIMFAKVKKITIHELFILWSLLILVLPFTVLLWRFWNYLNQELYGIVISDDIFAIYPTLAQFLSQINIFHIYPEVDQSLRVNTNFLAMFFEWLIPLIVGIVLFCVQVKKKEIKPYFNIGIFLILYCIARFFLEYLRVWSQSQIVGCFSKSQRLFMLLFIVWCVLTVYWNKKKFKI